MGRVETGVRGRAAMQSSSCCGVAREQGVDGMMTEILEFRDGSRTADSVGRTVARQGRAGRRVTTACVGTTRRVYYVTSASSETLSTCLSLLLFCAAAALQLESAQIMAWAAAGGTREPKGNG